VSAVTSPALEAVFRPRSVAVVGASDTPGKMGTTFMRNLEGFEGHVVPVSLTQSEVFGRPAYSSLREVADAIDLAVIVVPAPAVPGVLADAAERGVPAAIVISGGFAELGEAGAELQREAAAVAKRGGVRLVGPNCFGVINTHVGLNASMALGTPAGAGDISLVTQSGAYGMAIYSLGEEECLHFSKVYAAGNKADIEDDEVLEFLADDDETSVICLFAESITGGRRWFDIARRTTPHKPIVITKVGRSPAGERAAVSHTAALAARDGVWQAAFAQAGAIVARSGLEMSDVARALDWQAAPKGNRIAVITNSGGTGVELTDLLADEGLEVPVLSKRLAERLCEFLPGHASATNPVDVTPEWRRFPELYARSIEVLGRSGEVDAVVAVLLHRAALDPEVTIAVRDAVRALAADGFDVPIYACWVASSRGRANKELLQSARVPCFEWPERTARAVAAACRYGRLAGSPRELRERVPRPTDLDMLSPGILDPVTADRLLSRYGVQVSPQRVCTTPAAAARSAAELGLPVVLKLVSPAITHKSDVGGVRTGVESAEAAAAVADEFLRRAGVAAVLIQPQLTGIEVIVGGYRDPTFGPVVAVGLGGTLVELTRDVVFRLPPLTHDDALEAIESLGYADVLKGARGGSPASLEALADTLTAIGDLISSVEEIDEIDLNPVIAMPRAAVAVDARIVVGDGTGR